MAKAKVRLELLPRTALLSIAAGYASPHVAETTRQILNRAKVRTPVRTGNLRASLQMKMRVSRTLVIGEVFTRVRYAHYVHDPTRPHLIRARRAKALRFEAPPGNVIFRRMVYHPGTKGNPFLREPMREVGIARGYAVTGYGVGSKIGFGLADG